MVASAEHNTENKLFNSTYGFQMELGQYCPKVTNYYSSFLSTNDACIITDL